MNRVFFFSCNPIESELRCFVCLRATHLFCSPLLASANTALRPGRFGGGEIHLPSSEARQPTKSIDVHHTRAQTLTKLTGIIVD